MYLIRDILRSTYQLPICFLQLSITMGHDCAIFGKDAFEGQVYAHPDCCHDSPHNQLSEKGLPAFRCVPTDHGRIGPGRKPANERTSCFRILLTTPVVIAGVLCHDIHGARSRGIDAARHKEKLH